MNSDKPTYEELYKMFELEMKIKNSLYYFITFHDMLHGYYTWRNIAGMDNLDGSTKRMQMLLHLDKIIPIVDVSKSRITKMQYTIHPN